MALNIGSLVGYLGLDTGDWDSGLDKAQDKLSDFGGKGVALAAAGGAAIGVALAAGVFGSMDIQDANAKLQAQLGLSAQDAATAGKLAGTIFAGNYGESIGDVDDAIRAVVQNIGISINSVDLQPVTQQVLALADTFDQDLGGTTAAVGQLIKTGLAANATEALDIVAAGFQHGADKSGDFLDTLNEYGTQFRKLGIDGATATGLISQGLQAGARDGDLVADAIKEFSIRAVDGSTTTAAGFKALGMSAKEVDQAIARGDGASVLGTVIEKLRGISDPAKQAQAATALFGTQAEDLGKALFALDTGTAASGLGDIAGAAQHVSDTVGGTASSNLASFRRQMQMAFVEVVGGQVLPVVNSVAASLATGLQPAIATTAEVLSGTLLPAATAVLGFISDHSTTFTIIAGVITAVFIPALVALGISAGVNAALVVAAWIAQTAASIAGLAAGSLAVVTLVAGWISMGVAALAGAAQVALAWLIAIGPIALVIAAVVGIVVLIVKNWDTIKAATAAAWSAVVNAVQAAANFLLQVAINVIGGIPLQVYRHWDQIKAFTSAAWNAVVSLVSGAMSSVGSAVSSGLSTALGFFTGLPGRIVGAVGDLGGVLVGAGRAIISGLIHGIQDSLGPLGSVLGGVTGFIKDHKGPPEYDAVLLQPAGQLIMGGLIRGIRSQLPELRHTLGDVTATIAIPAQAYGATAAGAAGSPSSRTTATVPAVVYDRPIFYSYDPSDIVAAQERAQQDAAAVYGLHALAAAL